MHLVDLELGRWIYLAIYLFLPITALLYLIRTFGLELKEEPAKTAKRHIEQADYWADIALNMTHSGVGTKSLASLAQTVQRNLDKASELLETAVLPNDQRQTLNDAYQAVANKLHRLQNSYNPRIRSVYNP